MTRRGSTSTQEAALRQHPRGLCCSHWPREDKENRPSDPITWVKFWEKQKRNTKEQKGGDEKNRTQNDRNPKWALTERVSSTRSSFFWLYDWKLTRDNVENLKTVCFKHFCSALHPCVTFIGSEVATAQTYNPRKFSSWGALGSATHAQGRSTVHSQDQGRGFQGMWFTPACQSPGDPVPGTQNS